MNRQEAPILVIDDEAAVVRNLERSLRKGGYDVVSAPTAEDGLKVLSETPLTCAITDLRMPGMGGHAFVRRALALAPETPIIVISGSGDMEDVIDCLRQGVSDFVTKPWSDTDIREAVRRAVGRRGQRTQPAPAPGSAPVGQEPSSKTATSETSGSGTRSSGEAASRAARSLAERVQSGELPIPSPSAVALAARALAQSDEGSALRMKEVVEQDGSLAGRIIKIANSSYYMGYGRVSDLKAAIARIGFREISHLIDTIIAQDFHAISHPQLRQAADEIWRHTWNRAVAMRFLAQAMGPTEVTPDDAYLAGLFCDIGAPFLLKNLSEEPEVRPESALSATIEHHAQVGATILTSWAMPLPCVETARLHHQPISPSRDTLLLRLLRAGERIAVNNGSRGDVGPLDVANEPQKSLGLSPSALDLASARIQRYLKEHSGELGIASQRPSAGGDK